MTDAVTEVEPISTSINGASTPLRYDAASHRPSHATVGQLAAVRQRCLPLRAPRRARNGRSSYIACDQTLAGATPEPRGVGLAALLSADGVGLLGSPGGLLASPPLFQPSPRRTVQPSLGADCTSGGGATAMGVASVVNSFGNIFASPVRCATDCAAELLRFETPNSRPGALAAALGSLMSPSPRRSRRLTSGGPSAAGCTASGAGSAVAVGAARRVLDAAAASTWLGRVGTAGLGGGEATLEEERDLVRDLLQSPGPKVRVLLLLPQRQRQTALLGRSQSKPTNPLAATPHTASAVACCLVFHPHTPAPILLRPSTLPPYSCTRLGCRNCSSLQTAAPFVPPTHPMWHAAASQLVCWQSRTPSVMMALHRLGRLHTPCGAACWTLLTQMLSKMSCMGCLAANSLEVRPVQLAAAVVAQVSLP